MTEEQRDHLRQRLQEERERVIGILARFGERRAEVERHAEAHSSAPFHAMHETDSYNQAIDALELSRHTRELAEIEGALKALREMPERFGIDERTGESIPFDQLDRIPWARTVRPTENAADLIAADSDVLRAYRNERYSG